MTDWLREHGAHSASSKADETNRLDRAQGEGPAGEIDGAGDGAGGDRDPDPDRVPLGVEQVGAVAGRAQPGGDDGVDFGRVRLPWSSPGDVLGGADTGREAAVRVQPVQPGA